jgi:hypothetical protein
LSAFLFLHDHREVSDLAGVFPEESDQFRFLCGACLANLKVSAGLILDKGKETLPSRAIDRAICITGHEVTKKNRCVLWTSEMMRNQWRVSSMRVCTVLRDTGTKKLQVQRLLSLPRLEEQDLCLAYSEFISVGHLELPWLVAALRESLIESFRIMKCAAP